MSAKSWRRSKSFLHRKDLVIPVILVMVLGITLNFPSVAVADPPAGTLDSSFGVNGLNTATPGTSDSLDALAIDASGRIIAGGTATFGGVSQMELVRYTSSGQIDSTFGVNGFSNLAVGTSSSLTALAIDHSGRIVVGGYAVVAGVDVFEVARFLGSGGLDTSFGTNGYTTAGPAGDNDVYSLVLDSSDRILVGGLTSSAGQSKFALGRYLPNGTVDTSFATSGFNTSSPGTQDGIAQIITDGSGRILASGYTQIGGNLQFTVARYLSNGSIDTTFGTNGFNTTSPGTEDLGQSLALDSSGRVVAGGVANIGGVWKLCLARYLANGTLDTSFGTSGFVTSNTSVNDTIGWLVLDSVGRIYVGEYFQSLTGGAFTVARYLSSGQIDSTYGTGGSTILTLGTSAGAFVVQLDASNRLLAVGVSNAAGSDHFTIARFLADPPPAPVLPPAQQSRIDPPDPATILVGSKTPVTLTGHFVEKISKIVINDKELPPSSWTQTPDNLKILVPTDLVGGDLIQIYNGSVPLLDPVLIQVIAAPTIYSLHFDNQGHGLALSDLEGITAVSYSTLPVLRDPNFEFRGWSLTQNGSPLDKDYQITSNTTLFALWQAVPVSQPTYDLHLDVQSHGSRVSDLSGISRVVLSQLPTLSDPEFRFLGWAKTPIGIPATEDFTLTENATLFAQWEKLPKPAPKLVTRMASLYFPPTIFSLSEVNKRILNSLISRFSTKKVVDVKINAYADFEGLWWNQQLSQFRANSVATYLRSKGLGVISSALGRGVYPSRSIPLREMRVAKISITYLPK